MKPKALDLFCCAGGATKGLQQAGFYVVGVDIKLQPRYCGEEFVQADALSFPLEGFDFIWASPVCKRYAQISRVHRANDRHPDQIAIIRDRFASLRVPWVIENVKTAPLQKTLRLDGDMFGLNTFRPRHFESNVFLLAPPPNAPFGPVTRPGAVTVAGHSGGSYKGRYGSGVKNGVGLAWREAMGIGWMTNAEISQAIPPAYAEFIGRQIIEYSATGRHPHEQGSSATSNHQTLAEPLTSRWVDVTARQRECVGS